MRLKMPFVCLFFVATFLVSFPGPAQSSSPQETLNQYISDLQKNTDDNALREKIIKFALEMKPSPAIPKEAERFMVRGAAAMESAKDPKDFKDAVSEFEKATLVAPWFANAYYNLGVAQDKAGLYEDAGKNLKLYLLAAPNAADTNEVEKLIYKIEYRQEKAAKESSPEVVAAKKETDYTEWLKKLDGVRYTGPYIIIDNQYENELTIRGSILNWRQRVTYYGQNAVQEVPVGLWYDMSQWGGQMQIVGREAKRSLGGIGVNDTFTISEDGNSITHVTVIGKTFTYYRQ